MASRGSLRRLLEQAIEDRFEPQDAFHRGQFPVAIDDEDRGNSRDVPAGDQLALKAFPFIELRPGDSVLGHEFLELRQIALLVEADADELHAFVLVFRVDPFHLGHRVHARAAPGGPEVDDHHLAPESFHRDDLAADRIGETQLERPADLVALTTVAFNHLDELLGAMILQDPILDRHPFGHVRLIVSNLVKEHSGPLVLGGELEERLDGGEAGGRVAILLIEEKFGLVITSLDPDRRIGGLRGQDGVDLGRDPVDRSGFVQKVPALGKEPGEPRVGRVGFEQLADQLRLLRGVTRLGVGRAVGNLDRVDLGDDLVGRTIGGEPRCGKAAGDEPTTR
jgi:hypothetical protein